MTADPAIVPEARLIPQVSYRQMRALARAGARVLHPACLDPVAQAGIPTRLRSTQRPECFGTLIDEHVDRDAPCIALRQDKRSACITVFGIPKAQVLEATDGLECISADCTPDRVRLFMGLENCRETYRSLHNRLIK